QTLRGHTPHTRGSRRTRWTVARDGRGLPFDEDLAKQILSRDQVQVIMNLHEGSASVTCWGCDLTYEYVKINGDYRS
uniref:bifunctional ornithine acetyltransferase/N-acetylglutamate synthase n=1 Tax=uncultured Faecalibaculum sp. TaxID=1729681 RepID=UPI002729BC58